jgi:hypothetical protein
MQHEEKFLEACQAVANAQLPRLRRLVKTAIVARDLHTVSPLPSGGSQKIDTPVDSWRNKDVSHSPSTVYRTSTVDNGHRTSYYPSGFLWSEVE